jgi:hypothetical protein
MKLNRYFNAMTLLIGATVVFNALPRSFAQEVSRTHPITVTGRALDEKGNPIEDAEVYLASPRTGGLLGIMYSDGTGAFAFENVPLPIEKADTNEGRDSGSFEVFGRAEGHAFAWRPLKWFYPDRKLVKDTSPGNLPEDQQTGFGTEDKIVLDLKFGPATKLRGRVVDESGQGIPNTKVLIRDAEPWSDDQFAVSGFESLNSERFIPPEMNVRQTDSEGWFEFTQLPADHRFSINVAPPGHSPRIISATTHEGAEAERDGKPLYSNGFELKFATPREVRLRVVYGDTKEPAERVGVGGKVSEAGFWETTSAEGLVNVKLPDGAYNLGMSPRIGTDYLPTDQTVTISADAVNAPITLELQPAAVVNITVVDGETGKPLPEVDVWWEQKMASGQVYKEARGWRSWEVETRISHYEEPRTNQEGKMRVLFPPGKHLIGVGNKSRPAGYVAIEADGREIECIVGKPVDIEFKMRKK